MKISYIVCSKTNLVGVRKKVLAQAQTLSSLGCKVSLFATETLLSRVTQQEKNGSFLINRSKITRVTDKNSPFSKLQYRKKLFQEIKEFIERTRPDFVYFRYPVADKNFFDLLGDLPDVKVVTEHQTKEEQELWRSRAYLPLLSEIVWGKKLRRRLTALTGVTKEICEYQLERSGKQLPYLVSPNGIDVSSVPQRTLLPRKPLERIELLAVAQVAVWHGLDRLIQGIAKSKKYVDVLLHIVGEGPALENLQEMVKEQDLSDHVVFHGFKTGDALDRIFDACHIAVGSLGIHRLGIKEASVLKVREYCARGIPFIYSPLDEDFPEEFPFRLKVPADDSPIDVQSIIDFAHRVFQDNSHPYVMREYATRQLDWKIKMKGLKRFLEQLASGGVS